MADKKISELTAATSIDGSEELAAVQDGGNIKVTVNQIKDFVMIDVDAAIGDIAAVLDAINGEVV
jgi:hypothetical protein